MNYTEELICENCAREARFLTYDRSTGMTVCTDCKKESSASESKRLYKSIRKELNDDGKK